MDYKKELLLYLYKNNNGLVEIYPVSENTTVTNGELKRTIIALKKDGLIDTDDLFRRIGGGDPQNLSTVKSLHIKVRITPPGEHYVRDTYMEKNDQNTLNIGQIVNVGGDNKAPISLANDHSDSKASQSIAIERKKRETAIQIIKYASLILSPIAAAIAIYQFFIK